MVISNDSFMRAESALEKHFNHTLHVYIDITGDLIAGTLLSQIIYWFTPNEDGETKLRVVKSDGYWLAKKREDWWKECRITPKQYDRAIKILIDKGLVESKLFMFNGHPTTHIRPIPETINQKKSDWKREYALSLEKEPTNNENSPIPPKGKIGISPKVKLEFDERGNCITESTTYNTDNDISKYRSNIDSCNNKDIHTPIIQSDGFNRQWWLMDDKKVVDIHNKGTLAAALDSLVDIPKRSKEHDYLYELITYFADTYKKKRRCKHPGIDYTKVIEYADKLTEFSLKADQDIDNESGTVYHKFSVYDYNLDDLLGMVDDYFAYKFDDCDYSFHHFMSDSVLKARFWQIENKYTKIAQ
jgi:hypothetical protein